MTLSYRDVADILKLVDASDLEEIDLDIGGVRLSVRRRGAGQAAMANPTTAPVAAATAAPAAAPAPNAAPAVATPSAVAADGTFVRAPTVGSFYRRPSPSEPPFVEVGQAVKAGDPVCLIEVMKLFTTITSPCDGRVAAILAEDAALVEFDQPLLRIEPA